MAYQPGDSVDTTAAVVFVIEVAVVSPGAPAWSPLNVNATAQAKKFTRDMNRVFKVGLIDLSSILAYRHEEHAKAAFDVIAAGAKSLQFRIVKMDSSIGKSFVSGSANP